MLGAGAPLLGPWPLAPRLRPLGQPVVPGWPRGRGRTREALLVVSEPRVLRACAVSRTSGARRFRALCQLSRAFRASACRLSFSPRTSAVELLH
eukprot:15477778-Alexandrium_andersonii.AAC.1